MSTSPVNGAAAASMLSGLTSVQGPDRDGDNDKGQSEAGRAERAEAAPPPPAASGRGKVADVSA